MNIIFFGTSEFAVPPLKAIVESTHKIIYIVTQPRRQKGRGFKLLPQPVEEYALKASLKIKTFDNIKSTSMVEFLKAQNPDLFVVIAFGQILSKAVLGIPHLYSINVHASLLPKYRGAAPIQRALINGEMTTGITLIRMNEALDKGDIIVQKAIEIKENEDAISLGKRLSLIAADLLIETLPTIEYGNAKFIPQQELSASYAPKLKKEDGLIHWDNMVISIRNLVRGCQPWPSAYTYFNQRLLKILEMDIDTARNNAPYGTVLKADNEGIFVACKGGTAIIKRLHLEGKKPLGTAEFLKGNPIPKGTILG